MEHQLVTTVAGVRFAKVGKIYHFDARNIGDLVVGDQVVVETSRGWQLGSVAQVVENMPVPDGMKLIDRRATPRDLLLRQTWQAREEEVLDAGRKRARELGLIGIKVVSAEYSFDGSRLTVMFSSESEEKFDLKSMRQDLQRAYSPAMVEMRQIGPRDVAKMMGGMGACGKETRCCSEFLCEFSSISIRMAKEQGISLTPTEITGMCGRLRCCLIYEYDQYTSARALLPKRNKRVLTPQGEGKVLDQVPMRDAVIVQLMDDTRREFTRAEIRLLDESGAPIPAPEFDQAEPETTMMEPEADLDADGATRAADQSRRMDMGQRPPQPPRNRSDSRGGPRDRDRRPQNPNAPAGGPRQQFNPNRPGRGQGDETSTQGQGDAAGPHRDERGQRPNRPDRHGNNPPSGRPANSNQGGGPTNPQQRHDHSAPHPHPGGRRRPNRGGGGQGGAPEGDAAS